MPPLIFETSEANILYLSGDDLFIEPATYERDSKGRIKYDDEGNPTKADFVEFGDKSEEFMKMFGMDKVVGSEKVEKKTRESHMIDVPRVWSDESTSEETVQGSQTYTYAWSDLKEKSSTDTKLGNISEDKIMGTTFTIDVYKRTYKYSNQKNQKIDKNMMFKMLEPVYKMILQYKIKYERPS